MALERAQTHSEMAKAVDDVCSYVCTGRIVIEWLMPKLESALEQVLLRDPESAASISSHFDPAFGRDLLKLSECGVVAMYDAVIKSSVHHPRHKTLTIAFDKLTDVMHDLLSVKKGFLPSGVVLTAMNSALVKVIDDSISRGDADSTSSAFYLCIRMLDRHAAKLQLALERDAPSAAVAACRDIEIVAPGILYPPLQLLSDALVHGHPGVAYAARNAIFALLPDFRLAKKLGGSDALYSELKPLRYARLKLELNSKTEHAPCILRELDAVFKFPMLHELPPSRCGSHFF